MAITVEHLDSIVRLQQLERRLRYMAFTWSRDAPSAQEDLEQVARVAVWEELRLHPDAPDQNLLARAKRAIWRERLRGRSVDGRLNLNGRRPQSYTILSLEAPRPGDLPPLDEMLGSGPVHAHDVWESPVEGEAVGRTLFQELRRLLDHTQEAWLTLVLCGYQSQEAGRLLGMTKQQAHIVRLSVQRVACEALGLEYPGLRPASHRRHLAGYGAWLRERPPVAPEVKRLIVELFDALLE